MKRIALLAFAALITACSAPVDEPVETAEAAQTSGSETPAPMDLQPVVFEEISDNMPDGLYCNFLVGDDTFVLLRSRDELNTESRAVARIDGDQVYLPTTGSGPIEAGGRFESEGVTLIITPRGDMLDGHEGDAAFNADLTAARAGAEARLAGVWTCGA